MVKNILQELKAFWVERRREVYGRWKRSLPFGDYVVDRWEKAKELGFGEGASCYDSVVILGDVKVGKKTWIGPFAVLDGSGGLTIGSNCSISAGVQIYSHDSVKWAISGGQMPYEEESTKVGDNCYIGPNCVIGKGVTIGAGSIIGANSLVLKDIPENSKAHGNPCVVTGCVKDVIPPNE